MKAINLMDNTQFTVKKPEEKPQRPFTPCSEVAMKKIDPLPCFGSASDLKEKNNVYQEKMSLNTEDVGDRTRKEKIAHFLGWLVYLTSLGIIWYASYYMTQRYLLSQRPPCDCICECKPCICECFLSPARNSCLII